MPDLLRTARTVAGLRSEQLWFQVWRRAQGRAVPRPVEATLLPADALGAVRARLDAEPPPPAWDGPATAAAAVAGEWDLLGMPVRIGAAFDWRVRAGNPLRSFHLQYHEPLRALAWRAWRTGDTAALETIAAVVTAWIASTAGGVGDGWHPYPVSVRAMAWCEVLALVGDRLDAGARAAMIASLASQLDVLARRRERQIDANHLQRNHAALAIGGLALHGARAARWRATGLAGTWDALARHVLPDGTHYERSPMYHAGMLGDVLRVVEWCDALGVAVPAVARARIGAMARALRLLTRPDGSLHQFNDTAAGIAPPTAWLLARAARVTDDPSLRAPLAAGDWLLRDAGYAGWRDEAAGTSVVFDAGPAGPREQPGHAHCDALALEVAAHGVPLVVNAGIHGYDGDPWRAYSRGTAGHSTVQVADLEQHELWATFRVARFGRVEGPRVRARAPWHVEGTVEGYAGGRHARAVERVADDRLRIVDTVAGPAGSVARARFLLHPSLAVVAHEGHRVVARGGDVELRIACDPAARVRVARGEERPPEGWHFPTFGDARPAACVVAEVALPSPPVVTELAWTTA